MIDIQPPSWLDEMKRAFRDPKKLCAHLGLPAVAAEQWDAAASEFPLFAPYPYVQRIRPGDLTDPLLRQVLPVREEAESVAGFVADPVQDLAHQSMPGVIRKYEGRALVIASGACAIHCRYCFRRHFPYSENALSIATWEANFEQLATDPRVTELILSGGDPLTLRDETLRSLIQAVGRIGQLRRLRIHTRLPIVIPQRVTATLVDTLANVPLKVVVVVHVNHAQEIDDAVIAALASLRHAGVTLLNQAVLLRGVNDDLAALAGLSELLVDHGVLPYYLHQLDRVQGAAHFEVPLERGLELMRQLQAKLPGYAVPRFVRDEPGQASKQWLG